MQEEKKQDLKTVEIFHPLDKLGQYAVTGGPGRPKGLKNKFTQIKEDILAVWEEEDGKERLRELFKGNNKNDFIKILTLIISLLPKEPEEVTKGQKCPEIIYIRSSAEKKLQNGTTLP